MKKYLLRHKRWEVESTSVFANTTDPGGIIYAPKDDFAINKILFLEKDKQRKPNVDHRGAYPILKTQSLKSARVPKVIK